MGLFLIFLIFPFLDDDGELGRVMDDTIAAERSYISARSQSPSNDDSSSAENFSLSASSASSLEHRSFESRVEHVEGELIRIKYLEDEFKKLRDLIETRLGSSVEVSNKIGQFVSLSQIPTSGYSIHWCVDF